MCVGGEEEEEENYKASPLLTCSTLRESYRQVTRWGQNGRGGAQKGTLRFGWGGCVR